MTELYSLTSREADAERARLKLERDLEELRSPETFAGFKRAVTDETIQAKDELVAGITSKAKSTFDSFVEDLKGKATANPGAVLAIGAGLAWHFARKPPITTALVGLGLYSLLRTRPHPYAGFAQARENLKNQAGEWASAAGQAAVVAKDVVVSKAVEITEAGSEKASELATAARDQVKAVSTQATQTLHNVRDNLSDEAARVSATTRDALQEARSTVSNVSLDNRDALLLGIAGIAVSAAVGISIQRRLASVNPN
jgi:hypothetical protein